jgi:hypothetical protein
LSSIIILFLYLRGMPRTRRKNAGGNKQQVLQGSLPDGLATLAGTDGRRFAQPPARPVPKKNNKGKGSQVITVRRLLSPEGGQRGQGGQEESPGIGNEGSRDSQSVQ